VKESGFGKQGNPERIDGYILIRYVVVDM